jgi:hypothetical protein
VRFTASEKLLVADDVIDLTTGVKTRRAGKPWTLDDVMRAEPRVARPTLVTARDAELAGQYVTCSTAA